MTKNHPASEKCIACEKTLEEVKGRRIGLVRRGQSVTRNMDEGIKEREKIAKDKMETPWICQICDGSVSTCSKCRQPSRRPMGRSVVDSKGFYTHISVLPVRSGCINKNCEEYMG